VAIIVGVSTLVLEAWMLIEAAILWPKVRGIVEVVPAKASRAG
jgi:hypothetical protein